MSSATNTELQAFTLFLNEKVRAGGVKMSPEEALELWRAENPSEEEFEETVEALRDAVAEFEAGVPGKPHEQFDREFRARHGLPPK